MLIELLVVNIPTKEKYIYWCLHNNADSFVTWRYIEDTDGIVMFIDPDIMLGLKEHCKALVRVVMIKEAKNKSGMIYLRSLRKVKAILRDKVTVGT